MRLNKTTHHAVRILVACARSDGQLKKVAQLSDELGLTQQNTFKIVHLLSRLGFVESVRGRYGGVRLARPTDEISLGQVVHAMEVEVSGDAGEKDDDAGLGSLVNVALQAFVEVLDQNTLADMVKEEGKSSKPNSKSKKAVAARHTSTKNKKSGKTVSTRAKNARQHDQAHI